MELTAVLLFITTVAAIYGCIAINRKQAWRVSPAPMEVEMPISEAFAKIEKKMKEHTALPPSWCFKDRLENAYIVAELDYRDDSIKCSGSVHFDFSDPIKESTKIRWTCQSKTPLREQDIACIQGYISDWIRLILFPPPPVKIQTVWSNNLVVCRPLQYCFAKMYERLSTTNDLAHQWELIDIERDSKIQARLQHVELHNKQVRCCADVVFEFSEDGKNTILQWTYQITDAKNDTESTSLRYLTDEWIKLIFLV